MFRFSKSALLLSSCSLIALNACLFEQYDNDTGPSVEVYQQAISTDEVTPVALYKDFSITRQVFDKKDKTETVDPKDAKSKIEFVDHVEAPVIGGDTLQANVVASSKDYFAVGYNIAKEEFGGAIQIFKSKDVDEDKSELSSNVTTILFNNLDIQALHIQGDHLIAGGHSPVAGEASCVVRIKLKDVSSAAIENGLKCFDIGHGVVSLVQSDKDVHIALGGEGGGYLVVGEKDLDSSSPLDLSKFYPQNDLRQFVLDGKAIYALSGDADGSQSKIYELKEGKSEVTLEDVILDFSTKTADEHRNDLVFTDEEKMDLFISARADAGIDIYNTKKSKHFQFANPTESSEFHANGVTYSDEQLFVAQGEYGVRLLNFEDDYTSLKVEGFFEFSDLDLPGNLSANALRFEKDYLVVASGVGGALIYTIH